MAKPLPHDEQAERVVLGTCCTNPELIYELSGVLSEDDFYVPKHRWIFVALANIVARGEVPSVALIDLQMEIDGHKRYGIELIGEITETSWTSAHSARALAQRVREMGNARRLLIKMRDI